MRRRKAAAAANATADAQIAARTASYNPTFGAGVTATGESQPCPAAHTPQALALRPQVHIHSPPRCAPPSARGLPACPPPAVRTSRSPTKKGLVEPEMMTDSPLRWVGGWWLRWQAGMWCWKGWPGLAIQHRGPGLTLLCCPAQQLHVLGTESCVPVPVVF